MIFDGALEGKFVIVRSITEEDARATLDMRLDAFRTRFLHPVKDDLDAQIAWIRNARARPGDYHFTVTDLEGRIIGNTALYDIVDNRAQLGRTLLNGNALQNYETYLLVLRFGFNTLKLDEIWGDTDVENRSALRFSEQFGFILEEPKYDPEMDRYISMGHMDGKRFSDYDKKICRLIYR